jgi:hypothetical protein
VNVLLVADCRRVRRLQLLDEAFSNTRRQSALPVANAAAPFTGSANPGRYCNGDRTNRTGE